MNDPLILRKQEQRQNLLGALYRQADGKEGPPISPQQWLGLGEVVGIQKQDVPGVIRFLLSEGLLVNKPASEAVALTHKGIKFVEEHAAQLATERREKLSALPNQIQAVLESAADTLQLPQLRSALPSDFKDLSDTDLLEALNELRDKRIVSFDRSASFPGQPVIESLHFGIANRSRVDLSGMTKLDVVTLGGEVFEIAYQRKEQADNRDGVLYLFTITDRKSGRGMRHVMLYRGGPRDWYAQDYDSRIEVVRLNAIRRAFDSNRISFDAPFEEDRYIELKLQKSDFDAGSPATDSQIREFTRLTAFWLGYKLNSNVGKYFVRFDNEQDLEYLNVSRDSVMRNLWFLEKQGYLENSSIPGNRVLTAKLIEEMESSGTEHPKPGTRKTMDNSRDVFVVHGHDLGMQQTVARFLEKLKLKPIILNEQASRNRTIIEKFEAYSSVRFAVVLLSPDDVGAAKGQEPKPRARQNVILELGYFLGALGRENVCALHKGDVELPSDLHGVIWVPYEGNWQLTLIKELKAAEVEIDLSDAL
jgi:predicted nucleotide-binding protein